MVKLKLSINKPASGPQDGGGLNLQTQNAPSPAQTPTPSSAGAPLKLKIKHSQPPTPATEQPASTPFSYAPAPVAGKAKQPNKRTQKRAANEDISPAAKRFANGVGAVRKQSLKLLASRAQDIPSPVSAGGPKIKLGQSKRPSVQKKVTLTATRRPPPPRLPGHGYDSEDSDAEKDPTIQQGFILRMQPGEDADYLHEAIQKGTIGLTAKDGGADVSLRFLTADYRRAIVRVRGRIYAAALVDLPCIVESMKSWDKRGWFKVSDICQMLLVLGLVKNEDEVKNYPLPREVDQKSFEYAHGLTPPMHYVRKRRFRKRQTKKARANVEEEVARLLREDEECERTGGQTYTQDVTRTQLEQQDYADENMDAEGEAIDTVEDDGIEYEDDAGGDEMDAEFFQDAPAEDDVDLEADLQNAFESDAAETPAAAPLFTDSPVNMVDQSASFAAVEHSMADDSAAETPAADTQEPTTQDEQSSDEDFDDEDDEDSPDVMDEDAIERAAEKQQQLEEVADLEREIENVKAKANNMSNQLLKGRELAKLKALEEDLRVKKDAFGLHSDD